MKKFALLPLLSLFLLQACAYSVHEVHVSGYEPFTPFSEGKEVTAHGKQFVILGFAGNTDYLESAYEELQGKCPAGNIVGITTEYQTALGFFSWTNHIYMKGLCTEARAPTKGKGKPAKRASLDEDEESTI